MRLMYSIRWRKGPPDRITPGLTGTWAQVKDGKGGATGPGTAGTGSHEELLWATRHVRVAQTSGGDRWSGAPSTSLSGVGNPPPHNSDTLHGLVAGNTHTNI